MARQDDDRDRAAAAAARARDEAAARLRDDGRSSGKADPGFVAMLGQRAGGSRPSEPAHPKSERIGTGSRAQLRATAMSDAEALTPQQPIPVDGEVISMASLASDAPGLDGLPPSGSFARIADGEIEVQEELDEETRRLRKEAPPPGVPRDHRLGETIVGRYRLEKLIGRGGMGRVYLATQFPLNRAVAIKILSPEFQKKDPQFVRRFFLEAATSARLNHPNTITVFDYGETERGELFIAMEYLKGRALSRVLATDGHFGAERTIYVSMQIVRALREAHAKGIVHRDLKPGNIMLLDEGDDADFAKVLDFGLVKLVGDKADHALLAQLPADAGDGELTRAGMFLGSPKYMSPEQIQGHELDARTDIYSLGVIMYQMIVGRVPFRGSSSVEIIYKHVNEAVPPVHELNPEADCPPEFEQLIRKTLSKRRDDRYASMSDLLQALKEVRRTIVGSASMSGSHLDFVPQYPIRDTGMMSPDAPSGMLPVPSAVPSSVPSPPGGAGVHRSTVSAAPPRAEAAFADAAISDVSRAELRAPRSSSLDAARGSGGKTLVPVFATLGLVVGLGAAAYFFAASDGRGANAPTAPSDTRPPQAAAEARPPQAGDVRPTVPSAAAPAEPQRAPVEPQAPIAAPEPSVAPARTTRVSTTIHFHSTPDGARVYEDDVLLGTTPFTHTIEREADSAEVHSFTFKRDGYASEVVRERVDTSTLKIRTTLRATPSNDDDRPRRPSTPRPTQAPTPSRTSNPDYKDNPY